MAGQFIKPASSLLSFVPKQLSKVSSCYVPCLALISTSERSICLQQLVNPTPA